MTSKERIARMFAHREADRVPIVDRPWNATMELWQKQGMPAGANYMDFFGIDRVARIDSDNSPRFEAKVIEETDAYITRTTSWGATLRNWKHAASTPEYLGFTIVDRDSWTKARERMTPSRERIAWALLEKQYPGWVRDGYWIYARLNFGFDVTHSWIVGTERLLCALVEDPEWCQDMFFHELNVQLALLDLLWDAGYRFDAIYFPDDMGYKGKQFFSVDMYRELVKPVHRKAIEWAHAKGVKAHMHSCGNINPFVPELIEIGLDALNPLEVKAGMDPLFLKQTYGNDLVFHGGFNVMLWDQPDRMRAEMERLMPTMKRNGGFLFASDHSIPSNLSVEDVRRIVAWAKELGSYE